MKSWLPVIGICALAAVSGFKVSDVQDQVQPKGRYSGLEAHETHASASLLGQFRTNITGWLWLRTDLYLHNGVGMRPLTEQEVNAGNQGVGTTDLELREGKVVTLVPSKDRDFRGVFGDIERATQAYRDMSNHSHNNPKAAMPLYRLMTWIDPSFVTGWTTGGAVLAMGKDRSSYSKAIEFLNEGREKNPESISILNQLGFTYTTRLHDFPRAIVVLEKAREIGTHHDLREIPEDELESLQYAYRWLALVYRECGSLEKMYPVLREALQKFPDDAVVRRMLDAPPLVLAPQTDKQPSVPIEEDHDHVHDGTEGHHEH